MEELNFKPFPILETGRLTLRNLNNKDAEKIMILRSDDRVNKFIDRPACVDIDDAKKFIEKIENGIAGNKSIYWVITLKDDDTLIGTICVWNISFENDMAELGYELHPDFQGKGMMQEAITKVIDYCFRKMKVKTITALPHPDNRKSINILLRNKFMHDEDYELVSKEDAGELLVYYLLNTV
ncbi:MAG: GNAT family N-acetyltransferase [Ginsengibacter sp.]